MKIPTIKLPKLFQRSAKNDTRSFLPVVIALLVFVLLIFFGWWVSPYIDSLYSLVPGYYQIDTYNTVTEEKNKLNEASATYYDQITDLEARYSEIPASEAGYAQMMDVDSELIVVLEDLGALLDRQIELDEELMKLRLPSMVQQYAELASDLNNMQKKVNVLSISVSKARRDLNELRLLRNVFDNCLMGINWNSPEAAVADAVSICTGKITPIQEKVGQMEIEYDTELDELSTYLQLLKEQWDAEVEYYRLISERNYNEAKKYDDIFVDRKRQISELDVVSAFSEFTTETLYPMQEELQTLKVQADQKEKTAVHWYQNNIERRAGKP